MTDNAVHASPMAATKAPVTVATSPKEAGFGVRHRRGYVLAIAIGVVMAVIAPLQTNYIPFWPRMAFWQILMLSGATIGLGVTEMVERWGRLNRWPWIEVPVIGVLIALPLTMIVMSTSAMFFGGAIGGAIRFSYNFGVTALISTAVTALNHWIGFNRNSAPGPQDETPSPPPAAQPIAATADRFAERLPLPLRSQQVIALQAEDHYLRVHLAGGESTLILMRLSDAIAELPADIGTQTHRSWWVAKDAVRSVTKAEGRATLTLDGGVEAPVSRSFYRMISEAGWLR